MEFLKAENKSSAQMAEEIGVQPSGISHILSGRNNPSLDFILKMLEKYPFISTEWLLFGAGSMYKDSKMQTLFDVPPAEPVKPASKMNEAQTVLSFSSDEEQINDTVQVKNQNPGLSRIVWFYENNTFEVFYPNK